MEEIFSKLNEHIKYSLDDSNTNFEWEIVFGSKQSQDLNKFNYINENNFKKIYDY